MYWRRHSRSSSGKQNSWALSSAKQGHSFYFLLLIQKLGTAIRRNEDALFIFFFSSFFSHLSFSLFVRSNPFQAEHRRLRLLLYVAPALGERSATRAGDVAHTALSLAVAAAERLLMPTVAPSDLSPAAACRLAQAVALWQAAALVLGGVAGVLPTGADFLPEPGSSGSTLRGPDLLEADAMTRVRAALNSSLVQGVPTPDLLERGSVYDWAAAYTTLGLPWDRAVPPNNAPLLNRPVAASVPPQVSSRRFKGRDKRNPNSVRVTHCLTQWPQSCPTLRQ